MTRSPVGVGAWRAFIPSPVMPSSAPRELEKDRTCARVAEASRCDSDGEAVVKVYLKSNRGDFSAALEMTCSPVGVGTRRKCTTYVN